MLILCHDLHIKLCEKAICL